MNDEFFDWLMGPGGPVDNDLDRRAARVLTYQVAHCPSETGRARGSLFIDDTPDERGRPARRIGSNLHYILDIEMGTGLWGPHHAPIVPTTKKALFWKGAAHPVASVKGQPGQNFIRPSIEAAKG